MVEEEREEAVGNPNGVVYAVAVKTDVEIIDGNLLRQISTACSLFCVGAVQLCKVTCCRRASADQPKGGLKVLCSTREKSYILERK